MEFRENEDNSIRRHEKPSSVSTVIPIQPPRSELVEFFRLEASFNARSGCTEEIQDATGLSEAPKAIWTCTKRLNRAQTEHASAQTTGQPWERSEGVWLEIKKGTLERRVVKVVRKTSPYAARSRSWDNELAALCQVSKPKYQRYFVQLHGWFESEKAISLAMEYCIHGDLERNLSGSLDETNAKTIVKQILCGVIVMHDLDWIHRDLKLRNVYVCQRGPSWHVKIGDFGLSKRNHNSSGSTHSVVGTPEFNAPEITGEVKAPHGASYVSYTSKVDLWSLGCLVHYLLSLRVPFPVTSDLIAFCASNELFLSDQLDLYLSSTAIDFVQKLLQPDPNKRMSAKAAAGHPWLNSPEVGPDSPLPESPNVGDIWTHKSPSKKVESTLQAETAGDTTSALDKIRDLTRRIVVRVAPKSSIVKEKSSRYPMITKPQDKIKSTIVSYQTSPERSASLKSYANEDISRPSEIVRSDSDSPGSTPHKMNYGENSKTSTDYVFTSEGRKDSKNNSISIPMKNTNNLNSRQQSTQSKFDFNSTPITVNSDVISSRPKSSVDDASDPRETQPVAVEHSQKDQWNSGLQRDKHKDPEAQKTTIAKNTHSEGTKLAEESNSVTISSANARDHLVNGLRSAPPQYSEPLSDEESSMIVEASPLENNDKRFTTKAPNPVKPDGSIIPAPSANDDRGNQGFEEKWRQYRVPEQNKERFAENYIAKDLEHERRAQDGQQTHEAELNQNEIQISLPESERDQFTSLLEEIRKLVKKAKQGEQWSISASDDVSQDSSTTARPRDHRSRDQSTAPKPEKRDSGRTSKSTSRSKKFSSAEQHRQDKRGHSLARRLHSFPPPDLLPDFQPRQPRPYNIPPPQDMSLIPYSGAFQKPDLTWSGASWYNYSNNHDVQRPAMSTYSYGGSSMAPPSQPQSFAYGYPAHPSNQPDRVQTAETMHEPFQNHSTRDQGTQAEKTDPVSAPSGSQREIQFKELKELISQLFTRENQESSTGAVKTDDEDPVHTKEENQSHVYIELYAQINQLKAELLNLKAEAERGTRLKYEDEVQRQLHDIQQKLETPKVRAASTVGYQQPATRATTPTKERPAESVRRPEVNTAYSGVDKFISFEDCLGRKFRFVYEHCRTHSAMHECIVNAFEDVFTEVVVNQVEDGKYELVDSQDYIIIPKYWEDIITPGANVYMRLFPLEDAPKVHGLNLAPFRKSCPSAYHAPWGQYSARAYAYPKTESSGEDTNDGSGEDTNETGSYDSESGGNLSDVSSNQEYRSSSNSQQESQQSASEVGDESIFSQSVGLLHTETGDTERSNSTLDKSRHIETIQEAPEEQPISIGMTGPEVGNTMTLRVASEDSVSISTLESNPPYDSANNYDIEAEEARDRLVTESVKATYPDLMSRFQSIMNAMLGRPQEHILYQVRTDMYNEIDKLWDETKE